MGKEVRLLTMSWGISTLMLKVIEKDNLDLLGLTKDGVSVARLNTEQGRRNLVKVMTSQKRDKILSKKDKIKSKGLLFEFK